MPIVDIEVVCDDEAALRALSAKSLADALAKVFGSPPGRTWTGRAASHLHVTYAPAAVGRQAFGGELVAWEGQVLRRSRSPGSHPAEAQYGAASSRLLAGHEALHGYGCGWLQALELPHSRDGRRQKPEGGQDAADRRDHHRLADPELCAEHTADDGAERADARS